MIDDDKRNRQELPDESAVPEEMPMGEAPMDSEEMQTDTSPAAPEELTALYMPPEAPLVDCAIARKRFSATGLSVVVLMAAAVLAQFLLMMLALFVPNLASNAWYVVLSGYLPMYIAAFPACYAVLRCIPKGRIKREPMRAKGFFFCLLMSIALLYVGNYVGLAFSAVLHLIFGQGGVNPLLGVVDSTSVFVRFLFMVICAPLFEEFIFRKQMLDRLHRYGEGVSILVSALLFALIHGNFSQLFYAFFLGLFFGYVYTRTGVIWYTIALHAIINFLGSIVAPWVSGFAADMANGAFTSAADLLPMLGVGLYSIVLFAAMIVGIVMLIIRRRSFFLLPTEAQLPKGMAGKTAFKNVGMLLAIILMGILTIVQSILL